MKSDVLVFSIALNGYQWTYKRHLCSQKRYCKEMGFEYVTVSQPKVSKLGIECCWLKLHLMRAALEKGYKFVLFLDADAYVSRSAPNILQNVDDSHFVYMAKGYSGRFNSGVILLKNCNEALDWLTKIIESHGQPIPEDDDVGWGENGHVIHVTKQFSGIKCLYNSWNSTYLPCRSDYIHHYSHGPMRKGLFRFLFHRMLAKISRGFASGACHLSFKSKNEFVKHHLVKELLMIKTRYVQFDESADQKLKSSCSASSIYSVVDFS